MDFDAYETWLGIPADRRPPTHYDLLGLTTYESDPAVIEQAALRRMSKVRLHQVGPRSDRSQEMLAELARARLVLMDPDRRAAYDAKLRVRGDSRPITPDAPLHVGDDHARRRGPRAEERVADVLGSLVLAEEKTDGPSTSGPDPMKPASPWNRRLLIGVIAASHVLLLWVFYSVVFSPSNGKPKRPDLVHNRPSVPAPAPKPGRSVPSAPKRIDPKQEAAGSIVAQVPATLHGAGVAGPEFPGPPGRSDPVPPEIADPPDRRDSALPNPADPHPGPGMAQQPAKSADRRDRTAAAPPRADDRIAQKLQKDKETYEADLRKIKAPVLKELDRIKLAAQKRGNLETLIAAEKAADAFEKTNKAPDNLQAKFRGRYATLRDRMVRAFETAKQEYTRQRKLDEALSVARDLVAFRKTTWDPRSSQSSNFDKMINITSRDGDIVGYDRQGFLKKDFNANAKLVVKDGKAYFSESGDERYVLCTHPFDQVVPAVIDFGDVTVDKTGTLTLLAHGYPRTNGVRVVVKVDGRTVSETRVDGEAGWQEIPVRFQNQRVVVEHHAVDWGSEFLFFDYQIVTEAPPRRKGR